MSRMGAVALILSLTLAMAHECFAGNNRDGTAILSWSPNTVVTDLSSIPGTRLPLYVQLETAPDIQELAISLTWTPSELVGTCYHLVPDSTSVSDCGWTTSRSTPGEFDGDSTYTWAITFPPDASKGCMYFTVAADSCNSVAATFCLTSVKARDSSGGIDTLAILGSATLLGGTGDACPVQLASVSPTEVAAGQTTTLTITGSHFVQGMSVSLRGGDIVIPADTVAVLTSSFARAAIAIPSDAPPAFDLVVGAPGGTATLMSGAVHTSSTLDTASCATITGVSPGGIGYVTYSQDANGYDAQIGRWDTPYPGEPAPSCGPFLPELEPDGESIFTVYIDVQCGGLLSFTYSVATYDIDTADPFNVFLMTPTGTVTLLDTFGQPLPPDHCYGHYWESSRRTLFHSLNAWANQQVQLVFSVYQNGWGDQTQARIADLAIRSCAETPLAPLTPAAQVFEDNPGYIDTQDLTPSMQAALACFQNAVAGAGGTFILNSAFRHPDYQMHLREVWDKWQSLRGNTDPECQGLRDAVQAEINRHQLGNLRMRPASPTGPHTRGVAIDANVSGVDADALAAQCGLVRPFPVRDPVHYQLP